MEEKIKEIIRQVGDIGENVSRLPAGRDIPEIELDIILGQLRVLYENIRSLRSGEAAPERGSDAGTVIQGEPSPQAGSTKIPASASGADSGKSNADAAETGTPSPGASGSDPVEPGNAPEQAAGSRMNPAKTSAKAGPEGSGAGGTGSVSRQAERSILADKYKSGKTFINESLAGQRGKQDISSKIQSKPIRNIASALGINDRFKLINELFNGDKGSFQNTIGILDGAANFNEAFTYINTSFDWDMEEDSVQLLLDLVRRKFIINQNE